MSTAGTSGDGRRRWLRWAIVTPYLWLLLFFLAPFAIILKISFADPLVAQPPFTPLLDWGAAAGQRLLVTFDNYAFLFQDNFYVTIYLSSVKMAAIATSGGEVTDSAGALATYTQLFEFLMYVGVGVGLFVLLVSPLLRRGMHGVH